jgi:hypothetical protein
VSKGKVCIGKKGGMLCPFGDSGKKTKALSPGSIVAPSSSLRSSGKWRIDNSGTLVKIMVFLQTPLYVSTILIYSNQSGYNSENLPEFTRPLYCKSKIYLKNFH